MYSGESRIPREMIVGEPVMCSQPLHRLPPGFLLLQTAEASLKNKMRFSVFFQRRKILLKPLKTLGCVYVHFNNVYVTAGCISCQ